MKILRTIPIVILLFISFAFSHSAHEISGTYGGSPMVKLELLSDQTFHYTDISNPDKPVDVSGDWHLEKNKIILSGYTSAYAFHDTWKIGDNRTAVKSRMGMSFYRLVKQVK